MPQTDFLHLFPLSKKDFIIDGFQKMNISMLEVALDDYKTYQDATKAVFLEKISQVFLKLKANEDTELKAYKGVCASNICPNKGCNGYSFVGNNSNNHIDLVFEETENDITDIYHCSDLTGIDKTIIKYSPVEIDIKQDEKADFKPTLDYLIKSQKCQMAVDELLQHQIVNKSIYISWVHKHKDLWLSLNIKDLDYIELEKFYHTFVEFDGLRELLEHSSAAKKGIEDYEKINASNENEVLSCLVNHEETLNKVEVFIMGLEIFDDDSKPLKLSKIDLKIDSTEFEFIIIFFNLFFCKYLKFLDKYNTLTIDQRNEYHNDSTHPMWDKVDSLKYHLQQRGML